ncbi:MotA/TolQ/ExbB proton channel family protein [Pontiella sulfatireligans]|uniref:Biopolymer transport protein ExbB n=1 Tax=Pontiella sulfatireligans TaxID=2750658 RepID=A0A6C2URB0_9BACT|nr:MotA/TolQ/ExbB proton channel family protein [Pontiella sulfatireligans]VGO22659.1 Biopolymer transport protein ExbB [Pontiella sulfatireligans]
MKKLLFIMALFVAAGSAFAQGDIETAAAAAAEQTNLWSLIKTGGWAMWPLGMFSFFMVALIIQNFISLRPKTLLHSEQMPELIKMMIEKKSKTALIYCRKHPSMFANTFGAGLERCLDGESEIDFVKVKESVEEASVEQMSKLMKPIDYLSIIGASSPMLGLLGTVSGMIKAFHTMGALGMGKPELLAANIGEALITTATGLIIAIPAMFFFFFFKKGFQKTLATLGRNMGFLFDALQTGKEPISFMDLEALEALDGE